MTTLKGVFPEPKPIRRKNFLHENVKNLRRMEQFFHTHKEEELQKIQLQKQNKTTDKYQNITSRVNSTFHESQTKDSTNKTLLPTSHKLANGEPCKQAVSSSKVSVPMLHTTQTASSKKGCVTQPSNARGYGLKRGVRDAVKSNKIQSKNVKAPSEPNLSCELSSANKFKIQYKSQGIQTLDSKDMNDLYTEGVIRYPTHRSPALGDRRNGAESDRQIDRTTRNKRDSALDQGDASPVLLSPTSKSPNFHADHSPGDETDFVKLNKERISIANKMTTQLNNGAPSTNYRKGVVPKYLRERKEAMLQKEQQAKAEALDPDCPEGHIPLPDSERKETLRMLKKNYQEFVKELNMMPIKTDTLRAQKRKMEIEKQLNKIEEGIKVFSRPKVYVKINA